MDVFILFCPNEDSGQGKQLITHPQFNAVVNVWSHISTFCMPSWHTQRQINILLWDTYVILRCVIPVVLSNNKNKLLVHMYTVTNTTIFLIVRLLLLRYNYMFRPSMLAIFTLYMKHLTISYIYTWVGVPHKLYPHSSVDIAYRKVLHVQPEDGQHWWPKHVVVP